MYSFLIRPLTRRIKDNNKASAIALSYFKFEGMIPGGRFVSRLIHGNRAVGLEREVMGLDFYNPVGLGAGLDVNGDLYNDLNDLGFSFVEIGPFNSLANIRKAIARIQADPQDDILAACIAGDYLESFCLAYDFCDFFVIDISENPDMDIFEPILNARLTYEAYKPIVVKIPEVLSADEMDDIVEYCMMNNIDGIEARSISQIQHITEKTKARLPIIANCHIKTPEQAHEALRAGASLVEVRMGLVREGPRLVGKILRYLASKEK
jgi:dihydroorotate dehydrogenase